MPYTVLDNHQPTLLIQDIIDQTKQNQEYKHTLPFLHALKDHITKISSCNTSLNVPNPQCHALLHAYNGDTLLTTNHILACLGFYTHLFAAMFKLRSGILDKEFREYLARMVGFVQEYHKGGNVWMLGGEMDVLGPEAVERVERVEGVRRWVRGMEDCVVGLGTRSVMVGGGDVV